MCGIQGVISHTTIQKDRDIVAQLALAQSVRGTDSTGIFSISKKWGVDEKQLHSKAYKAVASPTDFFTLANYTPENVMMPDKDFSVRAIVCHNRAATIGKVNRKNAHPFVFPNIIGVHNGTIHSGIKNMSKYETDSEALYAQMNDEGAIPVLKSLDTYSAFALVFFDTVNKTLNLVRSKERPLNIAIEQGTVYFASEGRALDWILARNNIYAKKIELIKPHELLTWDLLNFQSEPKRTDVTPVKPVSSFRGTRTGMAGWYNAEYSVWNPLTSDWEDTRESTSTKADAGVATSGRKSEAGTASVHAANGNVADGSDGTVAGGERQIVPFVTGDISDFNIPEKLYSLPHVDQEDVYHQVLVYIPESEKNKADDKWIIVYPFGQKEPIEPPKVIALPAPNSSSGTKDNRPMCVDTELETADPKELAKLDSLLGLTPASSKASYASSKDDDGVNYEDCEVDPNEDVNPDEDIFVDQTGELFERGDIERILETPCPHCERDFALKDVSNSKNELSGIVYIMDTGHKVFVCETCTEKLFTN